MAAKNASNEIQITRVYDAPVKAVWDAWTDPVQVAKWWGPRGFTITTHSKDLRVGGSWVYTMHGPDGTNYENVTKYFEVKKHEKLVYDHGGSVDRPPLFRVTVLFSESRGKTKMDMTMRLDTAQAAAETRVFIKKAGGNSTWDRLAEYLEKESTGKETFVTARAFDVPVEGLYNAWANPDQLSQWLAPTGFTMKILRDSPAEKFYEMRGAEFNMYGKIHILQAESPRVLVYTQEFCDENGRPSRHPKLPVWPALMLTTVEFEAESPTQSRARVTWQPHGTTTGEEMQAFINLRAGMTQGWTGSFDKLDTYLESINAVN